LLKNVEIWWQDETRIGQQGSLTRLWTITGTRPRVVRQQQFLNAYLFGAVCPAHNKAAAIASPYANTTAMNEHLLEISSQVAMGKHAVVIMDNAGWHTAKKVLVPGNLTLMPLPPYSPELNPEEKPWNWLKQHHLANRVFKSVDEIITAACDAWNDFVAQPGLIKSMCSVEWPKI
jgi:transposase